MKKIIVCFFMVLFLLSGCSTSSAQDEGSGDIPKAEAALIFSEVAFATPEEAIECYIAGLAEDNLQKALSACTFISYAGQYSLEENIIRTHSYNVGMMPAPEGTGVFDQINGLSQLNSIAQQTKVFILCLTLGDNAEVMDAINRVVIVDETERDSFIAQVYAGVEAGLDTLKVVECFEPGIDKEVLQRAYQARMELYNAKDATDRIVIVERDGVNYACAFMLLAYEDGWKIQSHGSTMMGIVSTGIAYPMDDAAMSEIDQMR